MRKKRLSRELKENIIWRQNGKCACCLERGEEFHHIIPIAIGGDFFNPNNIVYLCKKHHNLAHLCDIETLESINEYSKFLNN